VKVLFVDGFEGDHWDVFVADNARPYLLHPVPHFLWKRTRKGPMMSYGLKLFIVSGDHLVQVHGKIRDG
jgi:hypothetical protein